MLFSSLALQSKSPFGFTNVCVRARSARRRGSLGPFTEFSDAHWPRASLIQGPWGCMTVAVYPDLDNRRRDRKISLRFSLSFRQMY